MKRRTAKTATELFRLLGVVSGSTDGIVQPSVYGLHTRQKHAPGLESALDPMLGHLSLVQKHAVQRKGGPEMD